MTNLFSHQGIVLLTKLGEGLPTTAFWLPLVTLGFLGAAAWVDARKGRVPDPLILMGAFIVLLADGLLLDWPFAAKRLAFGFATAILIATINQLWYRFWHHDAIGLGDAKWTALAIMVFPWLTVVAAWVLASWLGVAWFLMASLFRRKISSIHFAPFLLIGLGLGLFLRINPSYLSFLPPL